MAATDRFYCTFLPPYLAIFQRMIEKYRTRHHLYLLGRAVMNISLKAMNSSSGDISGVPNSFLCGHTSLQYKQICSKLIRIIRIHHECEGRIEKSVPRITVWHQEACRVIKSDDPEGRIFMMCVSSNTTNEQPG